MPVEFSRGRVARRRAALWTVPLLLWATTGCSLHYRGHEVQLRYDARADILEALIIYEGVTASELEPALAIARDVLDGDRRFDLGFGTWNLETHREQIASALVDEKDRSPDEQDLLEEAVRIIDRVELVEVTAFVDEEQRLCAFQHLRLRRASDAVRYWNRVISRSVLAEEPDDSQDFPDPRTLELWRGAALRGHTWIRLEGDGLEVDLPLPQEALDHAQRQLIDDLLEDGNWFGSVLAHIRHLEHRGERLRLRFEAPETGVFRYRTRTGEGEVLPALRDALEAEGYLPMGEDLDLDTVRELLLDP